jgi:hypothetical protein
MAYLSSPITAAADRPQAMDDRNRSRRRVQWPRLNALSLVPPGARRPRAVRVWDEWSGPGPPVPPSTSPFVLGRAHFLTCLSARSEGPGLVGPVWLRPNAFPIGRDVVARAVQRWRPGHDAVKQCRLTLPSGHANLVARLLNVLASLPHRPQPASRSSSAEKSLRARIMRFLRGKFDSA